MPDKAQSGSPMGDIIGSARQRLEQPASPADRLKALVAATSPQPSAPSQRPQSYAPTRAEPNSAALPGNYFPQIAADAGITPKRKPLRGPARTLHISMRLSPIERDRLVQWCDDRNLSLPDGIVSLLDLAEGEGA